jgi:hypothetical protein
MNGKDALDSTFFLAFIGQAVTITTTLRHTVSDEQNTESIPIFFEGILLDHDDEYYYLGATPHEITQGVKKSIVAHIAILDNKSVFDAILEQIPVPTDTTEVN